MPEQTVYPYNDDKMTYDETRNRYVLTEQALQGAGINLRARIGRQTAQDASNIIGRVLDKSSALVYRQLHKYTINTDRQDYMIATVPCLRNVIYDVLLNEAEYFIRNGDLSTSANKEERERVMYAGFEDDVCRVVPGTFYSLIYAG